MSDAHKDNGGSAFPVPTDMSNGEAFYLATPGMTLRDWFAGQALSAIINGWIESRPKPGETWDDMIAKLSFDIADAMMEARK